MCRLFSKEYLYTHTHAQTQTRNVSTAKKSLMESIVKRLLHPTVATHERDFYYYIHLLLAQSNRGGRRMDICWLCASRLRASISFLFFPFHAETTTTKTTLHCGPKMQWQETVIYPLKWCRPFFGTVHPLLSRQQQQCHSAYSKDLHYRTVDDTI